MTRQRRYQLSSRLRAVADEMANIAVDLDYYGGLANWSRHGKELAGAAHIARSWAHEIESGSESEAGCIDQTGR